MQSKRTPAANVALGGILAALAVSVMCLGTLIPVATYVCPMFCVLLLEVVRRVCGSRMAWAWYGAAGLLSVLLAPDKEAALFFAFLGYYPIVKPWFDRRKGKWLWKGLLFNGSVLVLYRVLMGLLGLDRVVSEFREMGTMLAMVMLALGNLVFFLMDRLLSRRFGNRRK